MHEMGAGEAMHKGAERKGGGGVGRHYSTNSPIKGQTQP